MRALLALVVVVVVGVGGCRNDDAPKPQDRPATGARGKPVDVEAIARVAAPGITFRVNHAGTQTVSLTFEATLDGKKARGIVNAGQCELALMCPPLDVEQWRKNSDNLKSMMSKAIKDDPATVFEIGATELAGRKVIYTYSLGFVKQGGSTASNHGYNVYWNDGANLLVVMVSDGNAPSAQTFDEHKATADRRTLEASAAAVIKAFDGTL